MRSTFQYRQPLTSEQQEEVKRTATIVLDANILLNLVRYSKDSSDALFRILEDNAHRLWLPHQVGYEFYRNVEYEADGQQRTVKEFKATLKKSHAEWKKAASTLNDEARRHLTTSIRKRFETLERNVDAAVEKHSAAVKSSADLKPVLKRIEQLYDGKVGQGYGRKKLAKIYQDGLRRAVNKTPPGFEDNHDGDLVIWHQILDYAKAEKSHLLFVTEDAKNDWWLKGSGKPRPHPDLVAEFQRASGGALLQFQDQKSFMRTFEGDTPLANSVIREVESSPERRTHQPHSQFDGGILIPSFTAGLENIFEGYSNFLLKSTQFEAMMQAIQEAARNQIRLDPLLLEYSSEDEDPDHTEHDEPEDDGTDEEI